ncbi:hypothetical protein [Spirosoma terrae]|uniref:Secretion system C-terminal sorting domain-containing protein n=1 Tax=Spirosoma terrae TaxID=1968276 RepID=A0A6L9LES0_9BACT|nr:hypothetical protein [Spirosoma terrae]NDU95179.1 hypothetical protein [Spirosoma terrae]
MLPLMSKLALSLLMTSTVLTDPTTPKSTSVEASAFVTIDKQVRVSVVKPADTSVDILLRDSENQVVYRQSLNRKDEKYAVKLNVEQLADGKYELEVRSAKNSIRKQLDLSTKPVQQTNRVIAMY